MALSPTGPISMSQIKAELSSVSNSLRAYSLQAGFTTPDVMSDFFGYSPPGPPPPASRVIQLGNPPGDNTTAAACGITSGNTKYILSTFAITNGLEIFNDSGLTTRTYTNDPYGGNYAWLYDTIAGFGYAVTFDSSGLVSTVYDCIGGSPVPPSPTPPSPTPPSPTPPSPTPPSPTPPSPTPPSPTPTPATYSFLLAYDASGGVNACTNYGTYTNMSTKWSTSSSIGSGTYLYNTQLGAQTGDSGEYVSNGFYSNGSTYWDFSSGTTATAGTSCGGSPTPPSPPPTPPSPPPTPPSPPPTPPSPPPTYYTFFLGIGKDNFGDACAESSYPITVYAPNTPIDYNTTLYDDTSFTTPFSALQDYWYKDDASGKALQLSSGATIIQYIQC
jgi:hypothetical protein